MKLGPRAVARGPKGWHAPAPARWPSCRRLPCFAEITTSSTSIGKTRISSISRVSTSPTALRSSTAETAHTWTLFVRPRDPDREIWDGPRAGVDGAKSVYGADEAWPISELDEKLPALLQDRERLYYRMGQYRAFDDRVLAALDRVRGRSRAGVVAPSEIVDPGSILHDMRLRKSQSEVETMRSAASITREAHELAMRRAQPGMHEYEVEALLLDTFRRHGSERPAYGSIVGSGPNACVLHYRKNDRRIGEGELLLIDAGCELGYYASDVTRTFPVARGFSREQQAIYELVLEAQLAAIPAVRPGATLEQIHGICVQVITRGLARLGLLSGRSGEACPGRRL
jgi:Xaa-Pro aminopeptidase